MDHHPAEAFVTAVRKSADTRTPRGGACREQPLWKLGKITGVEGGYPTIDGDVLPGDIFSFRRS